MKFKIDWKDYGRDPTCAPDPRFPNGCIIDITGGRTPSCEVVLPYPAKRCGSYWISCETCGFTASISTAGRPDDPHTVRFPCIRRTVQ